MDPRDAPTRPPDDRPSMPEPPPPAATRDERYLPGEVIQSRYRIVARLGAGGMGEVYRADDLRLGQPVALKFLPRGAAHDPRWSDRLRDEVRAGRRVTHPNVCRLHDLVDDAPDPFLVMEFVEGEDLASLLRRAGGLRTERATALGAQICAGLAAIHDEGLVHRDLKPANVLIDARGRPRITDFGIAAAAGSDAAHGVAGTPAYMAPEQATGDAATPRSDLYALGLVLHELYTGRPLRTADAPRSTPASQLGLVVPELEPAIRAVIDRCLDPEPDRRPASAGEVAAALHGDALLELAQRAGETPAPELVLAAGGRGGMPRPRAALLAIATIALLLVAGLLEGRRLEAIDGDAKSPVVLRDRAREIAASLVGADRVDDEGWGFRDLAARERPEGEIRARAFWYRSAPHPLVARMGLGVVTPSDPPPATPGEVGLLLDARGALLQLVVQPLGVDGPAPVDLARLLDAASAEPGAEPDRVPPVPADDARTWTIARDDGTTGTVDAARWRDRIVWLDALPGRALDLAREEATEPWVAQLGIAFGLAFIVVPGWLAFRHLRSGRGDRAGALRFAIAAFGLFAVAGLLRADHVANEHEIGVVRDVLEPSLYLGALAWALYLSVEPFIRRRWPELLIGWRRLLEGRWRDPRVGTEILVGVGVGAFAIALRALGGVAGPALGGVDPVAEPAIWYAVEPDGLRLAGLLVGTAMDAVVQTSLYLAFLVALRALVRRRGVAIGIFALILYAAIGFDVEAPAWLHSGLAAAQVAAGVACLVRFGFLAAAAALLPMQVATMLPTALGAERWESPYATIVLLALAALAVAAAAIAARPVRHPRAA